MRRSNIIVLIILYLGFISLGLPDKALGVAWPDIRRDLSQPLDAAGIIIFIIAILNAISSCFSGYLIKRFSILSILLVSGLLTTISIFGYGVAESWNMLILFTIPLGLGAGAVDTSLNCYVSENYSSKHMNWLHGCWGVGALLGPAIMTNILEVNLSWRWGYIVIGFIQLSLVLMMLLSKKHWSRKNLECDNMQETLSMSKYFGFAPAMSVSVFFLYTGLETAIGLWYYSVMTEGYRLPIKQAGYFIVLYWSFLTIGRFAIGFISNKIGNVKLLNYSFLGVMIGLIFLLSSNSHIILFAICLTGFSLSAIYPAMTYETHCRFKKSLAQSLMGFQSAAASLGVAILTPAIGICLDKAGLKYFIPIMIVMNLIMMTANYKLNKIKIARTQKNK